MGRVKTETNELNQTTTYETDFNGDTINYNYDTIGRLDRKTFTDSRVPTVSYTYDPVTSQLKTVTDGRGVTKYDYDTRDRLKTITMPEQKTVSYGYDLLDNITSLTTQAGTTTYGYDKLNRLDTVKDGNRTLADYDYDFVGNLIQTLLANGSTESRKYDTRNRLTQLTTKNVTGTVFSDLKYIVNRQYTPIALEISLFNYDVSEINNIKGEALKDGVTLFIIPLTDDNRK